MELLRLPTPPTVGREELASWLGVKPAHLYHMVPKLQREHGFPLKLPGTNGQWSRAAVIAWINGSDGVTPPPAATPAAPLAPTLEQLYGGAA